jgi:hypothetical protein
MLMLRLKRPCIAWKLGNVISGTEKTTLLRDPTQSCNRDRCLRSADCVSAPAPRLWVHSALNSPHVASAVGRVGRQAGWQLAVAGPAIPTEWQLHFSPELQRARSQVVAGPINLKYHGTG